MNLKIFKSSEPSKEYKDSKEYLERGQNIDAALVLLKMIETGSGLPSQTVDTAKVKLYNILDKL